MAKELRVHILAKELNVSSKAILDKCRAEGLGDVVKNHMSKLSAGLGATIREWFSASAEGSAIETAEAVDLSKVRVRRRRRGAEGGEPGEAGDATATAVEEQHEETEELLEEEQPPVETEEEGVAVAAEAPGPAVEVAEPAPPVGEVVQAPEAVAPAEQAVVPESPMAREAPPPAVAAPEEPVAESVEEAEAPSRKQVAPAGPQHVPLAAKLKGPRVVRYEAPEQTFAPRPRTGPRPAPTSAEVLGPASRLTAEERAKAAERDAKKGRINPRRAEGRKAEAGERIAEWRDQDLLERRERLAGATGRKIHRRRSAHGPAGPVGAPVQERNRFTLHEPVSLKDFCATTGVNFLQIFKLLQKEQNIVANINMIIPNEVAELLGISLGIDLEIVPRKTLLDGLRDEFLARPRTESVRRPPVVTVLGHVDHGKTSLLDAIRRTRVVAGEDGGITQHIGGSTIDSKFGRVTFLDTPGHEAFTAMRARGAQLTDVVVLVVAADDGVMPQTVEAINHAKAAGVPIVVALTKIDLGDQNKLKIYGQLAEHGLSPSEWGGDVDVIPTSVMTGVGIDDLLEHLAALSELADLKADPTLPAYGTVIEAETREGVGPVAHVLVQDGTLRVGDMVVCGNGFGKVRALVSDRGERLPEATPATPIAVWGLDDVPQAGDNLFVVQNMQFASQVASEVRQARLESSRQQSRKVLSLEEMFKRRETDVVPELNLVLKADVDGSVSVLRDVLNELPSDEVRLSIRHAGVGAVNDSDVLLAATCQGLIVAFRVDATSSAKRLAEQHGVEVRSYRIIYQVADDIRKALEGLLAPEERIESRATVEVRNIFHISKVGTVAGCLVTNGTVDRNQFVKIVRDGVLVREGAKIGSLRRFKDDVKEVRSGMECGIRLDGFDDLHEGDVLETYDVVKVARTLQ